MEKGKLIVYYGPMFSGKSEKMIEKMEQLNEGEFQAFKPLADLRTKTIYSRSGKEHEAINVENSMQIIEKISNNIKDVFIDEINFFDEKIINVINELLNKGINVYASGLDLDYKAEQFGFMVDISKFADEKHNLSSICEGCGKDAHYTARFINGVVDSIDSNTVLSETLEDNAVKYLPMCEKCHPYINKK